LQNAEIKPIILYDGFDGEMYTSATKNKKNYFEIFVSALILSAGSLLIIAGASSYGVGMTGDSVSYLALARNILNSGNFAGISGEPFVLWPPGYSISLLVGAPFWGSDLVSFFLPYNLLAYIIFGLLAFKLLRKRIEVAGFRLSVFAVLMFSPALFRIFSFAFAEVLFLPLSLAFFLLIERFEEKKKHYGLYTGKPKNFFPLIERLEERRGIWVLILAGVVVIALSMVKYTGIVFLPVLLYGIWRSFSVAGTAALETGDNHDETDNNPFETDNYISETIYNTSETTKKTLETANIDVLQNAVFGNKSKKRAIVWMLITSVVVSAPLFLLLLRNKAVSGYFTGYRGASAFSIWELLFQTGETLVYWVFPVVMILFLVVTFVFGRKAHSEKMGGFLHFEAKRHTFNIVSILKSTRYYLVFIVIYYLVTLVSASFEAVDELGNRLLIPLFFPMLLVAAVIVSELLFKPLRTFPEEGPAHEERGSVPENIFPDTSKGKTKQGSAVFKRGRMQQIVFIVILLIVPLSYIRTDFRAFSTRIESGAGSISSADYFNKFPKNFEKVKELLSKGNFTIYTNNREVFYYLTGLKNKALPVKKYYNSNEVSTATEGLKSYFNEKDKFLIFEMTNFRNENLYTIEEIKKAVQIKELMNGTGWVLYSAQPLDNQNNQDNHGNTDDHENPANFPKTGKTE